VTIAETIDLEDVWELFEVLARFADRHHSSLVEHMKSTTYESQRQIASTARIRAEQLQDIQRNGNQER
jgi:hypothetical protein